MINLDWSAGGEGDPIEIDYICYSLCSNCPHQKKCLCTQEAWVKVYITVAL